MLSLYITPFILAFASAAPATTGVDTQNYAPAMAFVNVLKASSCDILGILVSHSDKARVLLTKMLKAAPRPSRVLSLLVRLLLHPKGSVSAKCISGSIETLLDFFQTP